MVALQTVESCRPLTSLEIRLLQFRRDELRNRQVPARSAILADACPRVVLLLSGYGIILLCHAKSMLVVGAACIGVASISLAGSWFHEIVHKNVSVGPVLRAILLRSGSAFLGLSPRFWVDKHVRLHHPFVENHRVDPDIQFGRLVRLHPDQPRRRSHRFQYNHMWFLMIFTSLSMLLPKERTTRARLLGLSGSSLGRSEYLYDKYVPFAVVWAPVLIVRGPTTFLSIFLLTHFVAGGLGAIITQAQHNTMMSMPSGSAREIGRLTWQLAVSSDVADHKGIWWWLSGGTSFHVTHHLVPQLTFLETPAATERLRAALLDVNLELPCHRNMRSAMGSHRRRLAALSAVSLREGLHP